MIEGISGVFSRISEIQSRIDEIKSLNKRPTINPLLSQNEKMQDNKSATTEANFSDVLKQVMEDNNTLAGQEDSTAGLDFTKLNKLVGSTKDSKELLQMLYKNLKPENQNADVSKVIDEASTAFGVDKPLIKAVIQQESEYNKLAVSPKGAMGLMQLMPQTAESLGVKNPFDVKENIFGGTRYLKSLMNKYNNNLELSLAAYNAGPEAVAKYGGIPPYEETQNYVKNVQRIYKEFKNFE